MVPAHCGSCAHFTEWRIEVEHALDGASRLPAHGWECTGIDLPSRPLTTVAGYT
ncbi:hypothetical protein ACFYZB_23980 [Streptomyces sp. NPDC001852]|uniref:hypothetical protein n=1 Tax=Streptomyces sp. NPDC001852 TaxID=3364619 RepID=UPI003683B987